MSMFRRIANVFRPAELSREIDDELAFHIAELTDELAAGGLSREAAAREARRRFGGYGAKREEARDMDIARWLESLWGDLRYGARQLRLNPGFATVAVLSLALGIGANSAIFQLINALRLRSLPVNEPGRLAVIDAPENFFSSGWFEGRNRRFTFPIFEQMTLHSEPFSGLMAFATQQFNLSEGGEARKADGLFVTPNFLAVLGVAPIVGNWLPADTDLYDCSGAGALLDYEFWQREYGGDPSVAGRDISLNGRKFPILAVTPRSFFGVEAARRYDAALPLCADALFDPDGKGRLTNKTAWWLTPMGRLETGWSLERASDYVRNVSPEIFRATLPESYRPDAQEKYLDNKLTVAAGNAGVSSMRRQYANPLWILLASTGLVLLIACANLANLLLARASVRERELALRQAVGASRKRLMAQLMSESFLLAGAGAVLGGVLAYMLSRGLVLFLSNGGMTVDMQLGLDWRVFGFTAALAALTCLLFGLTPAIRASKASPNQAMRGGRGSAAGAERHGLRRALVVSQIALSFVLLVGALLFGQSLRNLLTADTGIDSNDVLVAAVNARLPHLESAGRRIAFDQLQESLESLPDVASVAMVLFAPFSGSGWNQSAHADDDPEGTGGKPIWVNRIGPGYFETLGTPLFAGRDFTAHDDLAAPQTAIVNEKLAKDLFGDKDPIGRSFRFEADAGEQDPAFQIVGLVKNTKYDNLREEQRAIAFLPLAQGGDAADDVSYMIRARGSFGNVMNGVRERMAEVNGQFLVEFKVLNLQINESVLRERLMANLSGGFGLLAALLSALGLYGVMSYMVARRRNEIGVRMALGAERSNIRGLVFGEAGRLLLVGLGFGMAVSAALSRYAESLLFGLEPNDATTLGAGCVLLGATAALAASIPVRRATRLDPAVVLRDE